MSAAASASAAQKRERSSKPAHMRYGYDLDKISKPLSKFFGKVQMIGPGDYILHLRNDIPNILQEAGLADDYKVKSGIHIFTHMIDDLPFTYTIEPYGLREHFKPNGVVLTFHPAEDKRGKKKMYVGYLDGEADALFGEIVEVITSKKLKGHQNEARKLRNISELHHGIKPNRRANKTIRSSEHVFMNPDILKHISSFTRNITRNRRNMTGKFPKTMSVHKNAYQKNKENREKIIGNVFDEEEETAEN